MKSIFYNRKLMITIFAVLIVICTLFALVPLAFSIFSGAGVKTEPVNPDGAKAASEDINGEWHVTKGDPKNFSSVGFTIHEILPAEDTVTSGSTTDVDGTVTVSDNTLRDADVTVNMDALTTDKKVRDQNMKSKLLETDKFPEATFRVTKPVDLAAVPDDGSMGQVDITGELTVKDQTKPVTETFDVLRDGDHLVVGGDVHFSRDDFGIETPDMIAAKIDQDGAINVRLNLEK